MAVVLLERLADGTGLLANPRRAIKLPAGWTVVDHPLDVLAGTPGGSGEVTGYLELVPGTGLAKYPLTTTDAAAHTLATLAIPAASTLDVGILCVANLGTGPNQNRSPCVYRFAANGARVGTSSVTSAAEDNRSSISAPFVIPQNSATPGPGSVNVWNSGNNMLLQVCGFAIKEAWTSGHTYTAGNGGSGGTTPGDFVTTADGGAWVCVVSGTASGSTPSGTGTAQGTGAKFDYIGPANGSQVTVTWTLVIVTEIQG